MIGIALIFAMLLTSCVTDPEPRKGKTYVVDPEDPAQCNHIAGHNGKDSIVCQVGEPKPGPAPQ